MGFEVRRIFIPHLNEFLQIFVFSLLFLAKSRAKRRVPRCKLNTSLFTTMKLCLKVSSEKGNCIYIAQRSYFCAVKIQIIRIKLKIF